MGYSLALAAGIAVAWLAIHIGGIFFWHFTTGNAAFAILLVLVQAWLSTGLFIVAHDCMHGSLAPGWPRLNAFIGTAGLGAYAGLSYSALLPKHHAHHAAPGTDKDPDFHAAAPRDALPWFVRFFRGYYSHAQILRITLAALVYMAIGASLINIIVFWAAPALIALVQLFMFGTYLPHRHEARSFIDHHNARSSELPAMLSLVTCFHFGAYHHEHHLHPGVPWWKLPHVRGALPRPR